jgi:hypothetical protein
MTTQKKPKIEPRVIITPKIPTTRILKTVNNISEIPVKIGYRIGKYDWSFDGRDKRKVLYMQNMSGMLTIIKKKYIKPAMKNISYLKNTFNFNPEDPTFRSKNTFYYLVDIHNGQLHIETKQTSIHPEMVGKILKRNIIKQLVSGLEAAPMASTIVMLLLGAGLGLACGYILGNFVPFG